MSAARWMQARSVLCVRLDNLGDVLMTTPALRAVKQSIPGCELTLLASPAGAQAARLVPQIDRVIEYRAPWVKQADASLPTMLPLATRLGAEGYDAAIIFTVYSQSALPAAMLCAAAGIPLRLAYSRENPYQLLSDWVHEREPEQGIRHEVRRQLDLVREVGCTTGDERLALAVPAAGNPWARERIAALGIQPGCQWVLLHPGASAPSRRYPVDSWIEAARCIHRRHACPIVVVGAGDDLAAVGSICRALPGIAVALCADLDVARLAAVIACAPVLLCNNSGPAHIAAAVGTPVVTLYALTNPQHTPWNVAQRVLYRDVPCRFCYRSACPQGHHDCMQGIAPAAVAAACGDLLGARARAPRLPTRTITELMAHSDDSMAIL